MPATTQIPEGFIDRTSIAEPKDISLNDFCANKIFYLTCEKPLEQLDRDFDSQVWRISWSGNHAWTRKQANEAYVKYMTMIHTSYVHSG